MDVVTRNKWDKAAANFDLMAGFGPEKRWEPAKRKLFSNMGEGDILFLAVGTGLDIRFFPEGRNITGIDISQKMLDQAAERTSNYPGEMTLQQADVHEMPFEEAQFDRIGRPENRHHRRAGQRRDLKRPGIRPDVHLAPAQQVRPMPRGLGARRHILVAQQLRTRLG